MTDPISTDQSSHEPAPAIFDSFAPVLALLTLAADPKKSSARVKGLRAATRAAEKAKADLFSARAVHDAFIAEEMGKLEKERSDILKRRIELKVEEGKLARREELLAQEIAHPVRRQRLVEMPGGMARAFHDEIDAAEPLVAADDSAVPNPQNLLPMPRERRPRGKLRRQPEWNSTVTLTREAE